MSLLRGQVADAGNGYHLYVSPAAEDGSITVVVSGRVGRRDRRREELTGDAEMLEAVLERGYAIVERWIAASGNTRTPVL